MLPFQLPSTPVTPIDRPLVRSELPRVHHLTIHVQLRTCSVASLSPDCSPVRGNVCCLRSSILSSDLLSHPSSLVCCSLDPQSHSVATIRTARLPCLWSSVTPFGSSVHRALLLFVSPSYTTSQLTAHISQLSVVRGFAGIFPQISVRSSKLFSLAHLDQESPRAAKPPFAGNSSREPPLLQVTGRSRSQWMTSGPFGRHAVLCDHDYFHSIFDNGRV